MRNDRISGGSPRPTLVQENPIRRNGVRPWRDPRAVTVGVGPKPARRQRTGTGLAAGGSGVAAAKLRAAGETGAARGGEHFGDRKARRECPLRTTARSLPRRAARRLYEA